MLETIGYWGGIWAFVAAGVGGQVSQVGQQVGALVADDFDRWSLELRVTSKGFELEALQLFPAEFGLADVKRLYTDTSLPPKVSNLVTGMSKQSIPGAPADRPYYLYTTATHNVGPVPLSVTTASKCGEVESAGVWRRDCELDLSKGGASMVARGGAAIGECRVAELGAASGVACALKVSSQPKAIAHYNIERLSLAGAEEAVHDFTAVYLMETEKRSPKDARARLHGSEFWKRIRRMYDEGRNLTDGGRLGGKTLRVRIGSRFGSDFDIRVE